MELRLALYELVAREALSPTAARRLEVLAGLSGEPAGLPRQLSRGVALLAAALGGLGVIFWVAAHWGSLGRAGQFALLQGLLAVMALGAWRFPGARVPLALLAWLNLGGLLAFFGQTYQTGADPWQLFALWALLTSPLALAVRSDALWLPWALVALTGVALWMQTFLSHSRWWAQPTDTSLHLFGWLAGAAVVAAFAPAARRWTGAGAWSLRGGVLLWVVMVTGTALHAMALRNGAGTVWLGILMLGLATAGAAMLRRPDIPALCVVALGLNTLLVCGLANALFSGPSNGLMGQLFVIGLVATALLAGTAKGILALSRRNGEHA